MGEDLMDTDLIAGSFAPLKYLRSLFVIRRQHVIVMKLKFLADNEDEHEESSEEIRVRVWTERTKNWLEPPIVVLKHDLTKWSNEFRFEDGQLLLQDGYCDNWNEVNDCVSLLKGLEVEVTFDNIKVLTTFGLHFKITPLLEAIGRWFKSVLNAEFFGKTISMIYKLKKLGFSEDELTDKLLLIPAMMEFVNNSSRKEFTNLLSDNFNELDLVVLKVLFNGENNHLDILLHTLIDRITSEDECEVILGFLERLLYSKEAEVVYVFSREVGSIIEQIENITSSSKNLGTSVRLFAELKRKSDTEFGTPHGISLELLQRTRCWREYSLRHLKSLKDNKNLKSWHVAEIYLDWIEIHEPSKDDFNELHQIVFDTLDADIEKCPYPQLYRYRYDIDGYFKRLSPKKCGDKSFCQRLTDFIKPALGFLFSNLNSIALVVVISWYWLMEPSKSLLAVNGGRVIITLFILNFCKPLFFGAKQFFQRWNVKISVREKNVQKLAASTLTPIRVKTYSSEGSIIRLLPLFYSDVQLENYHGTGKLKIENCCWKKDCNIKHWYIKSSFTKADGSFCSVFTHSHKEIVTFLTQQHEQLPKSISSRIYREIAYFVFGWSPISLFTINYD